MRLANGNDVFPIASIMGKFLHPPPSQGDYTSSMQTLNKHTEPPFCHFRRWILPCDSLLPPILSAPTLSAPTCHIYQQTMHPSANLPKTILIYPYPMYCHLPSWSYFSASFFYFYLSLLIMFFLKYLLLRIVTDNSPPKYLFMIEILWLMHWRVLKPHTS